MKRSLYFVSGFFIVLLLSLPLEIVFAQPSRLPVTYPGDTKETIARRAQWIDEAKIEGELSWWGTLNHRMKQEIITEFNKVYPFIKVDHWRGTGTELIAKIETEHAGGLHKVDVSLGGDTYHFARWRQMGIMQPFTDIIPGIEKMDKRMYSIHGDWAQPGNNAITPQYNTNLVSENEAPKHWEDLLEPKWEGKIGVPSNSVKTWALLAVGEGGWGIEKTENFLRNLRKQNIIFGRSYSPTTTLLIAGEFNVSGQGHIYHILTPRKTKPPLGWCKVDPVLITGPPYILLKKAPHPNAARLFLEWQFSPAGLKAYENVTQRGAAFPGAGTVLSETLEGLNLVYRTEETELKLIELNLIDRFSAALGLQ